MKKFLGTFFYALLLIIVIVVIFDISEKIDDFMEHDAPLHAIIFDYYMNFIPYFANLFSALFTFISVIFFTSKMAADSEIIAILSSGISYKRMLVPYFLSSLIIAIFSLILINWVIPSANKKRLEFENTYIKRRYYNSEKNIHRQVLPNVYIYMESYNTIYNIGYKFSMEKFENGKLKSKLLSDYMQWDTTKHTWKITNYYIRDFVGDKQIITTGRKIDSAINLKPEQFARRNNVVEAMNHEELDTFIEEEKMRGSDNVTLWIIEKNKRLSFPFSTIILTLIGVTLSSRKKRGGIGTNIGLGILLAFSYILFMQVSMVLATNANVNPVFAVWIPNILYALIGLFLYHKAAK